MHLVTYILLCTWNNFTMLVGLNNSLFTSGLTRDTHSCLLNESPELKMTIHIRFPSYTDFSLLRLLLPGVQIRCQLIPCYHKSQLRRCSLYHSKCTAQGIIYCAYLSCLFVLNSQRRACNVYSCFYLLPLPTLPDPQFFLPSSFSPSVWDYFMHD